MSYLVVKQSGSNKSFELKTSVPPKPYMAVKTAVAGTAYLALGTDTTGAGMLVKGNGANYKVVESYTTTRATTTNTIKNTTTSVNTQSTFTHTYTYTSSSQIDSYSVVSPMLMRVVLGGMQQYGSQAMFNATFMAQRPSQIPNISYTVTDEINRSFSASTDYTTAQLIHIASNHFSRFYLDVSNSVKANSLVVSTQSEASNYGTRTVTTYTKSESSWGNEVNSKETFITFKNGGGVGVISIANMTSTTCKQLSSVICNTGTLTSRYTVSQNTTVATTSNTTETITVQ